MQYIAGGKFYEYFVYAYEQNSCESDALYKHLIKPCNLYNLALLIASWIYCCFTPMLDKYYSIKCLVTTDWDQNNKWMKFYQ